MLGFLCDSRSHSYNNIAQDVIQQRYGNKRPHLHAIHQEHEAKQDGSFPELSQDSVNP